MLIGAKQALGKSCGYYNAVNPRMTGHCAVHMRPVDGQMQCLEIVSGIKLNLRTDMHAIGADILGS